MEKNFDIQKFGIQGRTILITGGYGYLARAMIHGLTGQGAHVVFVGRQKDKCENLLSELDGPGTARYIQGDIRDAAFRAQLSSQLNRGSDPLHGVVHAAFKGQWGPLEKISPQEFEDSYLLNVIAPFDLTRALLPKLERSEAASVVFIASMYGHVSPDPRNYASPEDFSPPHYATAKAGMLQLAKYFACHCSKLGIRFNTLSPGAFPNTEHKDAAFIGRLEQRIPLQRIGRAQELIGPVTFLLSPASSYMTGADLLIDGGWTAW